MSPQRKELDLFQRGQIIGAWKCGATIRTIAQTLNHPPSRARVPLPKNKEELWTTLQEEWLQISDQTIQTLVNSMPDRVSAVITSRGNPTKY
jgi:hypothetical protein